MALPCPLHAVFMTCFVYKSHAYQLQDSLRLQLLYKQKGTPKLFNQSQKLYIMLLVINSLGGGHTQTHTSIQTMRTKAISRNQSRADLWLACTWFNKIYEHVSSYTYNICIYVCIYK